MSELSRVSAESIALMRKVLGTSGSNAAGMSPEDMIKAGWTAPGTFNVGFQNLDLEIPAKSLVPVITPLRNRIPRMSGKGGIQANWKAVTAINSLALSAGVSDGNRNAANTNTTADYFASYRQIGFEDFVTWAAEYSADQFDDLRARAQTDLLWALMIAEERLDLGGNTSLPLGQATAPTLLDAGDGTGSIGANTTISVIVAALTRDGYATGTVVGGVRGSITRNNVDGSSDTYGGGTGRLSTNTTVTTANDGHATHGVSAITPAVEGAFGYAWFWGVAGSETLGAITTINSVVITTAAGSGPQTAASIAGSDNSTNALVYDGILTQICKTGAGYYAAQATGVAGTGTPLTADGVGGIVEIDTALKWFWDNYRLQPDTIWVSSQEMQNITKKVLGGTNLGAQRFMINTDQGRVTGGDLVVSYLAKFRPEGAKSLAIRLHPDLPPGTLFFDTETLPYPMANVPAVLVKRLRQDYFATLWAPRSRKWEYGVYADGVLQNYFPPAFGMITNIGNG